LQSARCYETLPTMHTIQDRLEEARRQAGAPPWDELTRRVNELLPARFRTTTATLKRYCLMWREDDEMDRIAVMAALCKLYDITLDDLSDALVEDVTSVCKMYGEVTKDRRRQPGEDRRERVRAVAVA
jgi:hypothetical protein